MELPNDLQTALNDEVSKANHKQLLDAAQDISLRYRERSNLKIQSDMDALAYAVARMPATYGAVYHALGYALENIKNIKDIKDIKEQSVDNIKSILDIGSGTGTAVWAARELLDLDSVVCIENDVFMRNLGKTLMASHISEPVKNAKWETLDITTGDLACQADLVTASYVINELEENMQLKVAENLWSAAKKILLLVETGTPGGYQALNRIRAKLLENGAHILAPCAHENACPVTEPDWCHFTCRIQRSRLHKMAKGGEAPFEDEKYAYLALIKDSADISSFSHDFAFARILRHPQIGKGRVKLNLCTKDGLKQATYTKRDGVIYKLAKKAGCGDKINDKSNQSNIK